MLEPKLGSGPHLPTREGNRPKRAPRWRDLTDEERWDRIYKDRDMKKVVAPKTPDQVIALALPAYALLVAISDLTAEDTQVRADVVQSLAACCAKLSSSLPKEKDRETVFAGLNKRFMSLKHCTFFDSRQAFVGALAHAIVRLADDYRYPADSPATMSSLLLQEDLEMNEVGDWAVRHEHIVKTGGRVYDTFLAMELYRYPTAEGL